MCGCSIYWKSDEKVYLRKRTYFCFMLHFVKARHHSFYTLILIHLLHCLLCFLFYFLESLQPICESNTIYNSKWNYVETAWFFADFLYFLNITNEQFIRFFRLKRIDIKWISHSININESSTLIVSKK